MASPALRVAIVASLLAASGATYAELNCNVGIEFHAAGGVRACLLNGHHRLHTRFAGAITCADATRVEQHPDGVLARCTLFEPARLEGQDCPQGAIVRFAASGAFVRCGRENSD